MTGQQIFQHLKEYKRFYKIRAIEIHCGITSGALQKAIQRESQTDFKESEKLTIILTEFLKTK